MANGGGPPDRVLRNSDYQGIKDGTLIESGTYAGCIEVEERFVWVKPDGNYWALDSGEPDEDQCPITKDVWELCENGGVYTWDDEEEYWTDSSNNNYRWAGDEGEEITMKEI